MICQKTIRNSWRKPAAAFALSLAALLPVKQVQAYIVFDPTHMMSNIMNWASNLEQWGTEFLKWEQQLRAMTSAVNNVLNSLTLSTSSPLTALTSADIQNLMNSSCPNPNGSPVKAVLSSVSSLFSPGMTSNPADTQRTICQEIVLLQADKYNRTVAIMNQINQNSGMIANIEKLLGALTGSSLTDVSSQLDQAQQAMLNQDTQYKDYQAKIAADNAAISALKDMQSNVANIALRGSPTFIGSVVQASAFAVAFK